MTINCVGRIALWISVAYLLWLPCPSALALDPSLDISQYAHTAWRIRDGFAKGAITAFAQTPDGYLWLGTASGLLRFDGVLTAPWQPPTGLALPDQRIRVLLAARDGTLWIGTLRGLASWNGVKLIQYPQFDRAYINALVEDREGALWVSGSYLPGHMALLCAIRGGKTACPGEDGRLTEISSLYVDSQGVLWVAAGRAVWRWKPGPHIAYPVQDEIISLNALSETAAGAIVALTRSGLKQLIDGKFQEFFSPLTAPLGAGGLLRDRDGAFWFESVDSGLRHVHEGRVDAFGQTDGLSGDFVTRLFEDREGSVWIATVDGIDRFRSLAVATYSPKEGISGAPSSVLVAQDGSIWLSTLAGLYRLHETRKTNDPNRPGRASAELALTGTQRPMAEPVVVGGLPQTGGASLFQDRHGRIWIGAKSGLGYLDERTRFVAVSGIPVGYIDSIAEDRDGNLWIAHRDVGLLQMSRDRVMERFPWTSISQSGPAWRLAVDSVHGGLWLGFWSGGVAHLVDGRVVESYSVHDGLGKGSVNHLSLGADGTVWAATEGGLSRIKAGRIATLDSRSGFPCDDVHSTLYDDDGAFWVHTSCGLVRIAGFDLDAWVAAVDVGNAPPRIRATVLVSSDGVRSSATVTSFSPTAAKSRDKKLWFVTLGGVEVVDPRHLPLNTLAPPVHIEQVTADRKAYDTSSRLRLPPLIRDLEIDYTALSLVAPEKNQFRYKLEGYDRDWQNVANRRQAFYTNLSPGSYRFRVVASNNSGVWNEKGDVLDFSIAPAYWQTNWFRALCLIGIAGILLALYQLRLRQLTRTFNMTLEARVGERTRIARELHDTLLQSFQGLLLRFQTVADLLPTRPTEAKRIVLSAVDQAAEAISEGRNAVEGLRSSAEERTDFAGELRTLGELTAAETNDKSVGVTVNVEGTPRALKPIVRDEIYRIAGEALRNALRHAEATQIELELRYDARQLRLRVRDDGKGIQPKVLSEASEGEIAGHHGLRGMRERASLIGGKLTVWTAPDSGTEVELIVRASRVYAGSASRGRSWLAQRFARKSA